MASEIFYKNLLDAKEGDITIICRDGERKAVSYIMKARSQKLSTIVTSAMINDNGILPLGSMRLAELEVALELIYTGKNINKIVDYDVSVYCLFKKWEIPELNSVIIERYKNPTNMDHYTLGIALKKYPETDMLCLQLIHTIMETAQKAFTPSDNKSTTNLSRRVMYEAVFFMPSGGGYYNAPAQMTAEKLREIVEDHRRNPQ